MEIRKLQADDFEKGFFETLEHLSTIGEVTIDRARSIFQEMVTNPVYHIYVAEISGQIVGTVTLLVEQKLFRSFGKVGHIENVATRNGFEGQGIGTGLVKHAIEQARSMGCYKMILDCSEKNVPFYERHGFRRNEVGMRLDLKTK